MAEQPQVVQQGVGGLQVSPLKIINVLQARLTQEISQTALLEAALQESQEREQALTRALAELHGQAEAQREVLPEANQPDRRSKQ